MLGGASYRFEYAEEKTKENPIPSSGLGFWGWDGAEKRFFGPSADNFGGVYLQTSKGWEGDKMVWEGSGALMGKKVDARDTFLRIGPADVTHTYELKMDGKWVTLALEQCKRAPAVPRR